MLHSDVVSFSVNGEFELALMPLQILDYAQSQIDRYQQAGYAVDPVSLIVNGEPFTRLTMHGFDDRLAATQLV